jgi:hypothetical protein
MLDGAAGNHRTTTRIGRSSIQRQRIEHSPHHSCDSGSYAAKNRRTRLPHGTGTAWLGMLRRYICLAKIKPTGNLSLLGRSACTKNELYRWACTRTWPCTYGSQGNCATRQRRHEDNVIEIECVQVSGCSVLLDGNSLGCANVYMLGRPCVSWERNTE